MASDYRGPAEEVRGAADPSATAFPEVRLLGRDGALLGIGELRAGRVLHPVVVLV
jgi:hypothetical protein